MILLDTNHLTVIRYPEDARHGILVQKMRDSTDQDFAVPVVALEEQMRGFYEQAVESLFNAIYRGDENVDMIAVPLLFLMRHSIELGYKFTLWELHEINEDQYP